MRIGNYDTFSSLVLNFAPEYAFRKAQEINWDWTLLVGDDVKLIDGDIRIEINACVIKMLVKI